MGRPQYCCHFLLALFCPHNSGKGQELDANHDTPMTLRFRCLPELAAILPPPVPAALGLPEWFKAMPLRAFNPIAQADEQTVKRCPPFIDAMTYGFLLPLLCDVRVADGEFTWDLDMPAGNFVRSPISFHDTSQVVGTPLFEEDRFIVKFHNLWCIEAPPGYSLLFTHPVNRSDLPFTTLTGLVDSDLYRDNWIHFPAHWHDVGFNGVLPKGTPVAQCLPVKREIWAMRTETLTDEESRRVHDLSRAVVRDTGIYRRQFRAPKR
jgi:hypothetical protein